MTLAISPQLDLAETSAAPSRGRSARTTAAAIVRHPSGRVGVVLLGALFLAFLAGTLLVPFGANEINAQDSLQGPSSEHLFGTDQNGRDQLARVAAAIPVAFAVPLAAVSLALVVGSVVGIVAAYLGGAAERSLMWVTDLFLALPPLLLAIVINGIFGAGLRNTIIAISLIFVPRFARIARASTLSVRNLPYVDAARLAGTPPTRLVMRHVLPSVVSGLVVMTTLSLSTALLAQASLSFVGMGVVPPTADLGNMLAQSTSFIAVAPWLVLFPTLAVVLMILGFNLLGDAVRDVVDPRVNRSAGAAAV